jgi:ParB family chromosome partitioning protein
MSAQRRGLGRGLGALIPTESTEERPSDIFFTPTAGTPRRRHGADADLLPVPGATFAYLDIEEIVPNPRQPRTVFDESSLVELVGSVREVGILQPIVVRPNSAGPGYELIMGERRLRAAKMAELSAIPAIIRNTDDTEMLRNALVENLHRLELNPLEEAAAYQQLLDDFGITHEQLAERLSLSRPQITNTLRLLKLPPLIQRRVAAGVLSAGHARALLGLSDPNSMEHLAQRIVSEGWSVRATEEAVALGVTARKPRKAIRPGSRTEALDELGERLGDRLDTRVKVEIGQAKGKIVIEFASVEDLNRIVGIIDPTDPGVLRGR